MIDSEILLKAEKGEEKSAYIAGEYFYKNGNNFLAFYYAKKSAQKKYLPAMVLLANFYRFGIGCKSDIKKARKLYLAAARKNDPTAMALYAETETRKDIFAVRRSINLFLRAARAGSAEGAYNLGMRYLKGEGVKKMIERARYYITLAAVKGYIPAVYELKDRAFNIFEA